MSETMVNPLEQLSQLTQEVLYLRAQLVALTTESTAPSHRGETSSLPAGFKVPNLETFSGGKNEDLPTWLFQIEEQFQLLNLTNEEQKIQIAGMALRKEAKVWYHFARNPDSPNRVTTWKEFTTQLRDNFCPIDPIKVARDRIADLRQVSSVRDYTSRFRQLTNIITNMSETEKLDRYVRGLKPRTRQEVDMKEPQTFIEAVKIAERIDPYMERSFQRPRFTPRPTSISTRPYDGPIPMDINSMEKQRSPLSNEEKEYRRRHKLCSYCGSPKHEVKDCTARPQKPFYFSPQGNLQGRSGNPKPRNANLHQQSFPSHRTSQF